MEECTENGKCFVDFGDESGWVQGYWRSQKDRVTGEHGSRGTLFSDKVGICDPDRIAIYDRKGYGG